MVLLFQCRVVFWFISIFILTDIRVVSIWEQPLQVMLLCEPSELTSKWTCWVMGLGFTLADIVKRASFQRGMEPIYIPTSSK